MTRQNPSSCRLLSFLSYFTTTRLYWCFIWTAIFSLIGQTSASYDFCFDNSTQEYLACHPTIGDIIWQPIITVSVDPAGSTCGTPPSTYRRLGDRTGTTDTCDASSPTLRHPPSYLIDEDSSSWWQSINQASGTDELNINITLSFNKTFRLAGDLIITFNSARPNKMVLEKSVDFGRTFTPLQFYARDCTEFQNELVPGAAITVDNPTAVVCTDQYIERSSRSSPGRPVIFSNDDARFALFWGVAGQDIASLYEALDTKMMEFLKFTDLRIRFIEPATDGRGNYEMYHYGVSDIQAAGRCFCNLHASSCNSTDDGLICNCEHNTMGKDCESCLPLYNERQWQRGSYVPFNTGTANECIQCECNDHAVSCTYNATYGRGICDECLHNTRGKHCELCVFTYYPNVTLPLNDENRCTECDCELLGVLDNDKICAQIETATISVGQCECKPLVTGLKCDRCIPGYYGLLSEPAIGNCTECGCNLDGTAGQSNACAQDTGQCPCKKSTTGKLCDTCADGYFAFPTGNPQAECRDCGCDKGGSLPGACDKVFGNCTCRSDIDGNKCDRAATGKYVPAIDILAYEPQAGACVVTSDLYTREAPFDGSGFAVCDLQAQDVSLGFEAVKGGMIQKALQWPYIVAVRYTGEASNISGSITVQVTGDTQQDLSPLSTRLGQIVTPGCPLPPGPSATVPISIFPGNSAAVLSHNETVSIDARCAYSITLEIQKVETPAGDNTTASGSVGRTRRATSESSITIDSVVLLPSLASTDGSTEFQLLATAENKTEIQASYMSCLQQVAGLMTRESAMNQAPCNGLFFSVGADLHDGADDCSCSDIGKVNGSVTCQSLGGQCQCKPGVSGRTCDVCTPGYFNLTENGCTACNCHPKGAENGVCDYNTGQCLCKPNIIQLSSNIPASTNNSSSENITIVIDGTCSYCQPNFYGLDSGNGCSACECNDQGSKSLQCDETGQCPCKDSVTGRKCDTCKEGYFAFGPNGCSACNCSTAGSLSSTCNQNTGNCDCKANVEGSKCADCKTGFFNLFSLNPDGCQPCFCYKHGESCTSATGFKSEIIKVNNPRSPDDYKPLLGDQHSSYGQVLMLHLSSGLRLDLHNEILFTVSSNGQSLQHLARNGTVVIPGQTLQYEVRLFEQNWVLDNGTTSLSPSALEVMGILANVTEVAPIQRSQGRAVNVTYAGLETAIQSEMPGVDVNFVEQCVCSAPANVGGLSCERCATGHRRQTPTDVSSYSTCVACDCNSRGATNPPECDELSGLCLNCRNGTAGDQCERCAPFVTGDECDTCQTQYWGLGADGCRACNCSSPGSQSEICRTDDGQCTCASNVVGRTCDECAENFKGLSATGCVECDACYSLMKETISPLRELRDQISSNITELKKNDMSDKIGPFSSRLQAASDDTEKLIKFLESAEQSETETNSQIQVLNSTLVSIQSSMSVIELNTTTEIEKALSDSENLINAAKTYRATMEMNVRSANDKIAIIENSGQLIKDLAADLKSVEQYLQSLADASTADQQILNDLRTLNETVSKAKNLSDETYQKAQAVLKVHQNNTGTLLTLQTTMLMLTSKATDTLTQARSLSASHTEMKSTVTRLQAKLTELQGYVIDYGAISSRTRNAQSITSSLQSQVTAETNLFSPSNTKALATVPVVEQKTNESESLGKEAASWRSRSNAAKQRSIVIQEQANALLTTAQNTLVTVNNFETQAEEVERKANASLQNVEKVAALSQQLMAQSDNLTKSLVSLKQLSTAAKESAQQALQMIQQKKDQLTTISAQAEILGTKLDSVQDVSQERYRNINNTKENILVPAQQQCEAIGTSVSSYKSLLNTTKTTTDDVSLKIANLTQRANALLGQMKSLSKIDTSVAQALLNDVLAARSNINVAALRTTVTELQTAKNISRTEIDRLKTQKDNLQSRIQNLRALQEQIATVL